MLILYITVKEKTKNIHRDINEIENIKEVLSYELERLSSDYEKMNTYVEIKDFAKNELKMISPRKEAVCFNVVDEKNVFKNKAKTSMPKLFDKNLNLALMEMKTLQSER